MSRPAIRRVEPEDWQLLRKVRLAALVDSPDAFSATFTAAEAYDDAVWRTRARNGSNGSDQATFLLTNGDAGVGMITGLTAHDRTNACELVSTWIAPSIRGRGHAKELTNTLIGWATHAGFVGIRLWVTETNEPAIHVYRSTGFVPTGTSKPLPSNPELDEALYHRHLSTKRA